MTKKEILEKLKKTYNRATDNIFSKDCHIFNNNGFTCQLTLNPDKTLTMLVEIVPTIKKMMTKNQTSTFQKLIERN